ncbi:(2Fe-2S)-binding protein [Bacillus sp. FSL W7-1360]
MPKQADIIVCRCESVHLQTLLSTMRTYNCSTREIKLRTRAGMGQCGGRMCRPFIDAIVGDCCWQQQKDALTLTYRPPVRPIPFSRFGGDHDEPPFTDKTPSDS